MLAAARNGECPAPGKCHLSAVGPAGVEVQADELGDVRGAWLTRNLRGRALLGDPPGF